MQHLNNTDEKMRHHKNEHISPLKTGKPVKYVHMHANRKWNALSQKSLPMTRHSARQPNTWPKTNILETRTSTGRLAIIWPTNVSSPSYISGKPRCLIDKAPTYTKTWERQPHYRGALHWHTQDSQLQGCYWCQRHFSNKGIPWGDRRGYLGTLPWPGSKGVQKWLLVVVRFSHYKERTSGENGFADLHIMNCSVIH